MLHLQACRLIMQAEGKANKMVQNEEIAAITSEKVRTLCIMCSFYKKLVPKLGNIVQGISKKICIHECVGSKTYSHTGQVGWSKI